MKKVPNGAAGLYLLGQVQELQSKHEEAIKNYKLALKQNPTLWCAYERLCSLKPEEIDASKFFTKGHPYIQNLNNTLIESRQISHPPADLHNAATF